MFAQSSKKEYFALGSIILVAFFVRTFDLSRFPLHHDEANRILAGVDHFTYFLGIPVSCFKGYVWPFSSILVSISRLFFSSPEYIVRVPPAIFGVLTIILVYFACRLVFGFRTAALSALLMAFLPWHIYQSRDGAEMIYTPFFGALLCVLILLSIKRRSSALFVIFCFFLGLGSFYTYGASLTYVFVFPAALFWYRREFAWLSRNNLLLGILIFLLAIFPISYLHFKHAITWTTFRSYHKNPFLGVLITNLSVNALRNIPIIFESLFISSRGRLLYAASFNYPLLINKIALPFLVFAFIKMVVNKGFFNKLIIIWVLFSLLGSAILMSFITLHYLIAALVPLTILMSLGVNFLYDYIKEKAGKRNALFAVWLVMLFLIVSAVFQSVNFYMTAPYDLEVCRKNSYGCKEAALFLSSFPGIDKCQVVVDTRMTSLVYLDYILKRKSCAAGNTVKWFVLWDPESHPKEYWDGIFFSYNHTMFNLKYPGQKPLYTVKYPNGLNALHVYRIENKKEEFINWAIP